MKTSGERLKALLHECGLTPSDFAAQRRVTPQHVNNWFRRGIPLARLDEIADLFCVHRRWLRCGEGPKHPSSILRLDASSVEPVPTRSLSKHDGRMLQVPFHEVREGRLVAVDGHCLRLPAQALKALGIAPGNAVSLAMPATRMTAWIPRDAILAIDLSQTNVVDGETYALLHNGVLRVNSLSHGHNGTLCLHSSDRHNHPVERYTRAQRRDQHLEILGWVFHWSHFRKRRPG
ncbi:S24 family peptidase [Pseudomonas plecoglossicida]|uniref:Transcriptional regulator n=1 Tax=Pseudomonas plecoglossicida TaxID=70775 RepID=A0AAD0QVZ3_PSEDL|nr:S24 family peptidase [Pseudomonas plecoglossicida]AXM96638.1 transcriptional regulator [Pseudomonas plecoglossicida]EPB95487.1 transcriptional regulator [Pseudomonas plecoglossicida NB2011]QLB57385.1 transcriptional regulator [Pseudomonas plecoglossicida]